MAGIAAGMFNEIFLMIVFGGVESASRGYFRRDWPVEFAGFIPPRLYTLCGLLLGFTIVEDG